MLPSTKYLESLVALRFISTDILLTEQIDLVSKHRKFKDAEWAMDSALVDEIEASTKNLEPEDPIYRHQRLFNEGDFDLFEEKGNFEEQRRELEDRRQKAIEEVFASGGLEAVLAFAQSITIMPWRVGAIFG